MTDPDLKRKVHTACLDMIEDKINTIQEEYRLYQDSAANETKSSAGDKHDTGKAMMQMEQEKLGAQFRELINNKKILLSINPGEIFERVQSGSLIITNNGIFYLSISLGKILTDTVEVYIISSQSPLAKLLMHKSKGSEFGFNGKVYQITEVY
jgi:hypothetical protein